MYKKNLIYVNVCLIFLGCDQNRYMPGCVRLCPAKCENYQCDIFNGSCIHGCTNPNALTLDCIGKHLDWNVSYRQFVVIKYNFQRYMSL